MKTVTQPSLLCQYKLRSKNAKVSGKKFVLGYPITNGERMREFLKIKSYPKIVFPKMKRKGLPKGFRPIGNGNSSDETVMFLTL